MAAYLIKFFFGVIILLLATQLFVKLAVKLSEVFRLSPLVIGMLVVSFGTTLPELSVSITSSSSGSVGLAAGTILGSTIVNFILVLPAAILLGKDIRIGTTKTQKNAIVLIIATILFVLLQQLPVPPLVSGLILLLGLLVSNFLEYRWGALGRLQEDKTVIDLFKKMQQEELIKTIPVSDYVSAISVGILDNQVLLDLEYEEDARAAVDMNFVMTGSGLFIEVQGTAEHNPFGRKQLDEMMELASQGIRKIISRQKEALGDWRP